MRSAARLVSSASESLSQTKWRAADRQGLVDMSASALCARGNSRRHSARYLKLSRREGTQPIAVEIDWQASTRAAAMEGPRPSTI